MGFVSEFSLFLEKLHSRRVIATEISHHFKIDLETVLWLLPEPNSQVFYEYLLHNGVLFCLRYKLKPRSSYEKPIGIFWQK